MARRYTNHPLPMYSSLYVILILIKNGFTKASFQQRQSGKYACSGGT